MKRLISLLLGTLAMLGLAACDAVNMKDLKPGVSTGYDVRDKLGKPGIEWRNDDGSVTWEYTRQPEGFECWMLTLNQAGVLQKIEQALTADNFARVEKGWKEMQVRRLLGKPRSEVKFPLKPEVVWEWRIEPTARGNNAFFHVHFNLEGTVTGTSRREELAG